MTTKNKKILFYDTTLRDGSQAEGISLSSHDKVLIAKRLDQFGVHYIEGGWPGVRKAARFFLPPLSIAYKTRTKYSQIMKE